MFCPNEGEIHLHVGLRKQPSKMAEIILHEIRHAAEYEWNLEVVEGEAFVTELARIDVALIRANKRLWRWLIATI